MQHCLTLILSNEQENVPINSPLIQDNMSKLNLKGTLFVQARQRLTLGEKCKELCM